MQYFEVAAVTAATQHGERTLRLKLKPQLLGDGFISNAREIPIWSRAMEPLSYPLLFTRGEPGWGKDGALNIEEEDTTFYKYLCSRLLMPDQHLYNGSLLEQPHNPEENDKRFPWETVRFNRFQAFARLGE
jgi:hypothetical protein